MEVRLTGLKSRAGEEKLPSNPLMKKEIFEPAGYSFFSKYFMSAESTSIGTGKIVVEFFSAAISTSVCS